MIPNSRAQAGERERLSRLSFRLTVWRGNVAVLLRNASGRADWPYVPERRRAALVTEARAMLGLYAILIAGSAALGSALLLWVWVIPAILGQPFLRAYLLAEHTRCPLVANMLENSRTTFTTALVRFIAWNMPYHSEHHSWPQCRSGGCRSFTPRSPDGSAPPSGVMRGFTASSGRCSGAGPLDNFFRPRTTLAP